MRHQQRPLDRVLLPFKFGDLRVDRSVAFDAVGKVAFDLAGLFALRLHGRRDAGDAVGVSRVGQ